MVELATPAELDREAFLWVVEHRVGWLDPVFLAATVAGYAGLLWIALAPALAAFARRSVLAITAATAGSVWAADLLAAAIKLWVGRPRPFQALPEAGVLFKGTVGSSFPSGHAATSFAGAVVLVLLLRRGVPALLALAFLVSYSRVYVGAHYPFDVIAGALLGAAVALAVFTLLKRPLTSSRGRPRSEAAQPPG